MKTKGLNIGDSVCCVQELEYVNKNELKKVKVGHALIFKNQIGDKVILERFNKQFIVDKALVTSYPLSRTFFKNIKTNLNNIIIIEDSDVIISSIKNIIHLYEDDFITNNSFKYYNNPRLFLKDFKNGLKVDFLITDIRLGKLSGIDIVKDIRSSIYKILVMSEYDSYEYIETFFNLGVRGYMMKSDLCNLPTVIDLINEGGTYFPKQILYKLINKNE